MTHLCIDCKVPLNAHNGNKRRCGNWYSTCKPCQVWRTRARKLGTTVAHIESLLRQQNGVCFLCDKKAVDLDHCHATGAVRKWLCRSCNIVVERVENNRTTQAHDVIYAEYIAQHKQ